jgi:hypothetical protein
MWSKGNSPKNGEPTVGVSFTTVLSTLVGFGQDFLANNNVTTLEIYPHSPDLTPASFYLFPRLNTAWKGSRFRDATDIIKNATEGLKRLSQNGLREGFQHLYRR